MREKHHLNLLVLTIVATVWAGAGCTAGARLSVLRPAMLNARQFGGTMTVADFDGHPSAAAMTTQELRQRIMNAEGQPVTLMAAGGAILIHGTVLDYSYNEQIDRRQETCTRSVTVNGQTTSVQVPCVRFVRRGQAHAAIAFNITLTQTGQTIYAATLEDSSSASRSATDSPPAHINGAAMLENLRAGLVERFARVILPWRETVHVRFGRCGDAREFCDAGIVAVRQGNFEAAIASFQQAVTFFEGQPEANPRHFAEAHWNLGLAREYSGDFDGAIQSILRAIELNGSNPSFAPELENVRQMAADAERLAEQGVTE